jgi:hypothetical protein
MTAPTMPAVPDQADYARVHTDIVALLEAARHAAARCPYRLNFDQVYRLKFDQA